MHGVGAATLMQQAARRPLRARIWDGLAVCAVAAPAPSGAIGVCRQPRAQLAARPDWHAKTQLKSVTHADHLRDAHTRIGQCKGP
jgi:hypothetical protein